MTAPTAQTQTHRKNYGFTAGFFAGLMLGLIVTGPRFDEWSILKIGLVLFGAALFLGLLGHWSVSSSARRNKSLDLGLGEINTNSDIWRP